MKIETVWGVYFSGTGTTKQVVSAVAEGCARQLGAAYKAVSFTLPDQRKQTLHFGAGDLVVVGIPVYAGRVPNLLLPYLTQKLVGNGALAIPICLYGNRNFDDGLMELRNLLSQAGFHPIAGGAFVGEHAFSRTLGAGRPDTQDMALAASLADGAAAKIAALTQADVPPVTVAGCDPIRPYYVPRDRHGAPINILKVKPKTDALLCTQCGLCASICPMGAIDPADVSQVPGTCIKCCACVKRCPMDAKYYDDAGYLYHQHELEDMYGVRRAESVIFL